MSLFQYDFMQRAFVAALIVGVIAPLIGVFLVQRRLALLGDGMGHVALTGVGLAFLVGSAPIPTALVIAALGAVLLEVIRARSRTAGDLALALVFYGGIAGGVFLTSLAGGKATTSLNQYLFGSLSTVSATDLIGLGVAATVVLAVLAVFGRELFAMSLDSELAQVQGIRTTLMSTLLTVMAAISVVGLLLVRAIMIGPIAAAQQLTRSFTVTAVIGVALGLVSTTAGLTSSYYLDVPPGPTIVLIALLIFVLAGLAGYAARRRNRLVRR